MARIHARSWRATYAGVVPDAVIADVERSQPNRIERWRTVLGDRDLRRGASVLEERGRPVGFAFWGPTTASDLSANVAEIFAIYLDPDVIGRGLGRALLSAVVNDIARAHFSAAALWVLATNDRARRFYEAAGWRPDGSSKVEERPGGSLNEVRYVRAIGLTPASASS